MKEKIVGKIDRGSMECNTYLKYDIEVYVEILQQLNNIFNVNEVYCQYITTNRAYALYGDLYNLKMQVRYYAKGGSFSELYRIGSIDWRYQKGIMVQEVLKYNMEYDNIIRLLSLSLHINNRDSLYKQCKNCKGIFVDVEKEEICGNCEKERNREEAKKEKIKENNERILEKNNEINDSGGWVYFILDKLNNKVKIGCALIVQDRLKTLQIGSFNDLELLYKEEGRHPHENSLHTRFRRDRIKGEWFNYSKNIKEYISSKTAG